MSIYDEAARLKKMKEEMDATQVQIALFGPPGAGKSALINKLTGQYLAEEGVHTDTTTKAKKYEWNGLYLVDLPGFGTAKFPSHNYTEEFKLSEFDVFLCVFDGKLREEEVDFFLKVRDMSRPCILVRNKRDTIWQQDKSTDELENEIAADVRNKLDKDIEVYFTSCRNQYGLDKLGTAIAACLEGAVRERWFRAAQAYSADFLDKKKEQCEKELLIACGLSAANALNPVPGLDISVDVSILLAVFGRIRDNYGLTDNKIHKLEVIAPPLAKLADNVLKYSTRYGIPMLLRRFAGGELTKEIAKWVPFVGQAVAAGAGFGVTYYAGMSYLEDCHELATAILKKEIT